MIQFLVDWYQNWYDHWVPWNVSFPSFFLFFIFRVRDWRGYKIQYVQAYIYIYNGSNLSLVWGRGG